MKGVLHSAPFKMNYKMIDFYKPNHICKDSGFLGDNKIVWRGLLVVFVDAPKGSQHSPQSVKLFQWYNCLTRGNIALGGDYVAFSTAQKTNSNDALRRRLL